MDALVSTRVVRAMTRTLRRRRHGPDTTGRAPSPAVTHVSPGRVRRLHRRRQPTATRESGQQTDLVPSARPAASLSIRIRVDVGCCTFFHWTRRFHPPRWRSTSHSSPIHRTGASQGTRQRSYDTHSGAAPPSRPLFLHSVHRNFGRTRTNTN